MNFSKTKIGLIEFTNCLPLNYSFERQNLEDIEFVYGTPAELNQLMDRGEIVAASISSFEYLQNQDKYTLIETACIASDGECGSVLLFSDKETFSAEEILHINGAAMLLGVPCDSASSTAMLKVLLNEQGVDLSRVNFVEHDYSKTPQEYLDSGLDAVLFIGDRALKAKDFLNYDLGTLWKETTGLPAVFGTWAVSSDWAKKNPEKLNQLNSLIAKAIETGLGIYFNEVIEKASCNLCIKKDIIREYLTRKIRYEFTEKHEQSLELFAQLYNKTDTSS